jgi:aryl-alcohol dehydrogenase-like predicted oxidoreductase
MNYRLFGRSGLRVSEIALGTMTFGEDWGWGSSKEEARNIYNAYREAGGNFIDTANVYTKGHSEKIIGDFVGRDHARRDRVVIATKFFGNLFPGDPNGGGAGRKTIVSSCEQSLRRLQTDYVDLYWMHCWDRLTPVEETMRALDDLVTSGKVRYIGFSDTPAWKVSQAQTMAQLRGWAPLVALQIEYSLLERTVEGELIPMAREMGLGVTPWSPLKSGVLSGKYTRENAASVKADRGERVTQNLGEKVYSIIDELIAIGKELGASPASVALAWVQGRPGVASTIIGARRLDQLDQNLAALALSLNADQVARLDKLSKPTLGFPMQFLNVASIFSQGGTTVNGEASTVWPLAPKSDAERY